MIINTTGNLFEGDEGDEGDEGVLKATPPYELVTSGFF